MRDKGQQPTGSQEWVDLVRGIEEGEAECERNLALRFRDKVYYLAGRRLREAGLPDVDAEDIWHETFMATLSALRLKRLQSPEKLPSYVCSIARNKVVDWIEKRRPERSERVTTAADLRGEAAGDSADTELTDLIRREWKGLPKAERQILWLKYVCGWDYGRICKVLDIREEAMRKRAQRAKERLRKAVIKSRSRPSGAVRMGVTNPG